MKRMVYIFVLLVFASVVQAGSISTGFQINADRAETVTGTQSGKVDAAYAHTTESSNTVHGGFILTAYQWATNAYAYAGRAWDQATNALAIAQTEGIFTAWLGTNTYVKVEVDSIYTDWYGVDNSYLSLGGRFVTNVRDIIFFNGGRIFDGPGNLRFYSRPEGIETLAFDIYDKISFYQDVTVENSGTNALTSAGLIDIGPALDKAESALQPDSTNGWEVGSHESFLTTNGSGSSLTGITAAQVGAVSTSTTITVNGDTKSLDNDLTFTVTGSTDAPTWIAATNTGLTVTLTNDLERPQFLYATGAVTLAFAGLRPPQPFYLIVSGPDSLTFPSGTHYVGGASWQTNMQNHFIIWQYGTNLFCNPVTTSEIP